MWQNRTHVGEFGLASASSSYKETHDPSDPVGSALRGNEIIGFKWRHSVVGGKGRTSHGVNGYVQVPDIVEHLQSLGGLASEIKTHSQDYSSCEWDTAEIGW